MSLLKVANLHETWPQIVQSMHVPSQQDDIITQASLAVEDAIDLNNLTGNELHKFWKQIVFSTHIDNGNPGLVVNPDVFTPPDLKHFLAVRCRAVSGMEVHGPNVNGDAFPSEELQQRHNTLIGKGFYIEHASHNPKNAVGIIAHSQWLDDPKYVVAVALVDKVGYPREANMIRQGLAGKTAGVSIGCIAGEAQCSVCGNVARKRYEVCACMDRSSPFCKKGRKLPNGIVAHDICKKIMFYELSYTRAPADKDARPHLVLGAEGVSSDTKEVDATPTVAVPDESELAKQVGKEVDQTVKSFVHKMIKGEIDRKLADDLRGMQMQLRPIIKKLVKQYQIGTPS